MAYYPKSQIKTNLYTNGEELVYKTTLEQYIGFYYKVSNGRFYTGKNPNDGTPLELIIFTPTLLDNAEETLTTPLPFNSEIIQIIKPVNDVPSQPDGIPYPTGVNSKSYPVKIIPRALPTFSITRPTNDDYNRGVYTKYFCKKNNELIYLEIDKDTYNKLISQDPGIAWDLYTPTKIVFQLGNPDANLNTIKLIEQNLKWYGFSQYFKGNFVS